MTEHAVIITVRGRSPDLDALDRVEDALTIALSTGEPGEYDGTEPAVDGPGVAYFMYGPDGDRLFSHVRPILVDHAAMASAEVCIRYGDEDDEDARRLLFKLRVALQ